MASKSNKPVHEIKLGLVKATIWLNQTESGDRHNVTFAKLYIKDEQWHETQSFGRDDLPLLMKVANRAHSYIFDQSASSN